MERVSQIAWNEGQGLHDLAERGTCSTMNVVDLLDEVFQKEEKKFDPEEYQRMAFLIDDPRGKIQDIEDAIHRFQEEFSKYQAFHLLPAEAWICYRASVSSVFAVFGYVSYRRGRGIKPSEFKDISSNWILHLHGWSPDSLSIP